MEKFKMFMEDAEDIFKESSSPINQHEVDASKK